MQFYLNHTLKHIVIKYDMLSMITVLVGSNM